MQGGGVMRTFRQWRDSRRVLDEEAVASAIRQLRPSKASGWPISRLACINVSRTYAALARLEPAGRVTSDWADGPIPRRRLYRLASEAAR